MIPSATRGGWTVKRLKIRHSRDYSTFPEARWDLWCVDTHDPLADPLFVGWGTWEACLEASLHLLVSPTEVFTYAGFEASAPF